MEDENENQERELPKRLRDLLGGLPEPPRHRDSLQRIAEEMIWTNFAPGDILQQANWEARLAFLSQQSKQRAKNASRKRAQEMDQEELQALYGPPAMNAPHKVGETIFYDDQGRFENGEVLYAAATDPTTGKPDLHYIVSPAEAAFPTPVWPSQIITAM